MTLTRCCDCWPGKYVYKKKETKPPGTCITTILQIETLRPDYEQATEVHVARDPATHAPRVIGIRRR